MSKAEKFIQENTNNGYNYNSYALTPEPWLTPDEAKEAVKFEREEMIERACDAYCKVCGHYPHKTPNYICRQACDYYKSFRNYMKGE